MEWVSGDCGEMIPPKEGWYRVMITGDSESCDGMTIYDYPDYEQWAYWTPADPEEFEDFEGGYKGSWTGMHDEESDDIFAYYGPFEFPSYKKS